MKKFMLPLILILLLAFTLIGDCDVIWKYTTEIIVANAETITIPLHADVMVDDLLIVYISKDDPNLVWVHEDWNGICNLHSGTQNSLYMAWRKVTQLDKDTPAKDWTWEEDSGAESWIGEILVYRGQDLTDPIHDFDTAFYDHDAAPIAPSVGFGDPDPLAAGSLVLQVFGCDDDDGGYVVPSPLASRFNTAANNVGGAGGDKTTFGLWVSPTGTNDPGEKWTNDDRVWDEDLTSGGNAKCENIPSLSWSDYLEATIAPISCSKVRFYAGWFATDINAIILEVYYSSGWHEIYEGAYANLEWEEKAIGSTEIVSALRAKFYNSSGSAFTAYWREADFWETDSLGGTNETGAAVFEMGTEEEWAAATVIIEAAVAEPPEGLIWNTKTITKWNTKEVTAINTQ